MTWNGQLISVILWLLHVSELLPAYSNAIQTQQPDHRSDHVSELLPACSNAIQTQQPDHRSDHVSEQLPAYSSAIQTQQPDHRSDQSHHKLSRCKLLCLPEQWRGVLQLLGPRDLQGVQRTMVVHRPRSLPGFWWGCKSVVSIPCARAFMFIMCGTEREFTTLPSGRRLRCPICKTNRFKNSFMTGRSTPFKQYMKCICIHVCTCACVCARVCVCATVFVCVILF